MTIKTATVTLDGEGLRFMAQSGTGHVIVLDDDRGDTGMRPSELLPLAVATCTAMDVVSILRKKRQRMSAYEVRTSGSQQEDHPHAFTRIDVVHVIDGEAIDVDAVRRAIQLSATRYCAVGATLSTGMTEIHHGYVIRDGTHGDRAAEVMVTGPHESSEALEARISSPAAVSA